MFKIHRCHRHLQYHIPLVLLFTLLSIIQMNSDAGLPSPVPSHDMLSYEDEPAPQTPDNMSLDGNNDSAQVPRSNFSDTHHPSNQLFQNPWEPDHPSESKANLLLSPFRITSNDPGFSFQVPSKFRSVSSSVYYTSSLLNHFKVE